MESMRRALSGAGWTVQRIRKLPAGSLLLTVSCGIRIAGFKPM
jgi:hypothetical protein